MREDPDVILVGELRDAETIRWAMTAAETGHLVLGTLHTTSAVKTIDRIVDALPADEREQTKSFLVAEPDRRRHAGAGQDAGPARPQGGLRGHGDEPRDRQADHDRPDAPDPVAAADRQGPRHADAWTRRCCAAVEAKESIPTTPIVYATRQASRSRAT